MSEGHRGGGYCPECGKATYCIKTLGEPFRDGAYALPPEIHRTREIGPWHCGWCDALIGTTQLVVLPDEIEARAAWAGSDDPKSGRSFVDLVNDHPELADEVRAIGGPLMRLHSAAMNAGATEQEADAFVHGACRYRRGPIVKGRTEPVPR